MSSTKSKPTSELSRLAKIAEEAKAEVERLRTEIEAAPGRLVEIERRLNSATSAEAARTLVQQRTKLREDREINLAAVKGAEIAALRAESAHVRACAESTPGLAEAIEADKQAQEDLSAATERAKLAGKARGRIERDISELSQRWKKLSHQADVLEGKKPGN